jgi:signal transduction histidine kinase
VELSVSDTGIGVEAKHLNNIVDPFFQADGTLARRHEGIGLGLTLCKMFVELHGGSLNVASELGEGTVITARFPAEIMQDAKDADLPRPPTAKAFPDRIESGSEIFSLPAV